MNRSRAENGFTLIEVMVALAILSVSLAVLLQAFSTDLERVRRNEPETQAALLLHSVMSGLGRTIPLQTGTTEGELAQGFQWRAEMSPFGSEADQAAWPVAVYAITASVRWHQGAQEMSVSAQTMQFGPKETGR